MLRLLDSRCRNWYFQRCLFFVDEKKINKRTLLKYEARCYWAKCSKAKAQYHVNCSRRLFSGIEFEKNKKKKELIENEKNE